MEVNGLITIDLGTNQYYDDESNSFIYEEGGIVRFEYSLKAIYDWESKWRIPFLKGDLTSEQLIDFYATMALDPINPKFIDGEVMTQLAEYIKSADTATKFSASDDEAHNKNSFNKSKIYTAEELYALMITARIPLEFENRNLNRLLITLRIVGSHSAPPKKMSKQDIYKQNARLNAERKAQMKTKG